MEVAVHLPKLKDIRLILEDNFEIQFISFNVVELKFDNFKIKLRIESFKDQLILQLIRKINPDKYYNVLYESKNKLIPNSVPSKSPDKLIVEQDKLIVEQNSVPSRSVDDKLIVEQNSVPSRSVNKINIWTKLNKI